MIACEPRAREPEVRRVGRSLLVAPVRLSDDADDRRDVTLAELLAPDPEDELAPLREEAGLDLVAVEEGVRDPDVLEGCGLLAVEPDEPDEPDDPEDPEELEPDVRGIAWAVATAGAAMAIAKATTTSE